MILHFVYEGDETGQGGEETVILSIFAEFLPCWKKKFRCLLDRKSSWTGLLNQ